jgi:hypothetical protein
MDTRERGKKIIKWFARDGSTSKTIRMIKGSSSHYVLLSFHSKMPP